MRRALIWIKKLVKRFLIFGLYLCKRLNCRQVTAKMLLGIPQINVILQIKEVSI